MVSLPENIVEEIDGIVSIDKVNRSELIREVMLLYIAERKRQMLREQMKRGYVEMAQINLKLALEGVAAEAEVVWFWERN
jgi:CopG family transcriptional regulator/antitoxin EndoAI